MPRVRRVKDKWKEKEWYTIVAPDMFGNAEVVATPAASQELVLNRVAEVPMDILTGDASKSHIKLYFQVYRVDGLKARTRFVGHDMTTDYVRRHVRRRRSRIDGVFDLETSDGYRIRVKPMLITHRRIKTSIKDRLREEMGKFLSEKASSMTFNEFVLYMLSDRIKIEASQVLRKIYPVREVEIRKSEVLFIPGESWAPPEQLQEQEAAAEGA